MEPLSARLLMWLHGRRRFGRLALFLAIATLVPGALQAQTGSITGRVAAEEGDDPLGFAQVVIVELERGALARADGRYRIDDLPPGTYTVRASIIGHRAESATVRIEANETASQDFSLATDMLSLDAVVVTATRNPRSKVESSTAITTMTSADIEMEMPRSTADLLAAVPGYYVESSGGEVGNNLFVRGLPADGAYRYVSLMEDGMPVYDATELFFVNADIFVRVDETVERMEAVRGGNSSLYGSNAPGGVINFISETGGPERTGSIKTTVGTGGLARYDMNVSGPVGSDWRYSVGGFVRYDQGVRDPGFPASRGGQIKANVTRLFDGGYLRVYGKYMNDRNLFMLPLPFRGGQDPQFVSGFPSNGTMTTEEGVGAMMPRPGEGEMALPLDDGQRQVGGMAMADLAVDLGGWNLRNTVRAMNMDHSWNAILPFNLVDADEYASSVVAETPGASGYELRFTNHDGAFDTGNGLLSLGGLWHVSKPMTDLSNRFQLQRTLGAHDVTVGTYFGRYTAGNTWYFNDILTDVRDAPRFVDLVLTDAGGNVVRRATDNGFRRYLSAYVNGTGSVALVSLFIGDEIELTDQVRIDVGARVERDRYHQRVEGAQANDLGGATDADDAVLWGDGSFTEVEHDFTDWAASVGANYLLSDRSSLYARASRGYKMPILDQYLFTEDRLGTERLWQAEGGYKLSSETLGLSAVAYWLRLMNFPSQDAQVDPETGETVFETAYVGEARTVGAEIEAVASLAPGLRLNGTLTLQDHQYVNFIEGGDTLNGNWVRRIPRAVAKLGGAYRFAGFDVGADWEYVGKRFSNNANTIELPAFGVVNARAEYRVPGQGIAITGAVLNLLDGRGLTEGNPRLDESLSGAQALFLARPILPRRITLAVRYDF